MPRALAAPTRSPRPSRPRRSIHIVALGNEGDTFHQDSRPSGLIRTYLGRSPLVSGDESSLLLNAAGTVARPVFTEYQASAFGNVKLVVHDCPVWVRGSGCAVLSQRSSFFGPLLPSLPIFLAAWREFCFGFFFFVFFFSTFLANLVLCFSLEVLGQPSHVWKVKSPRAMWSSYCASRLWLVH